FLAVLATVEDVRGGNSFSGNGPQQSSAGPGHAFQKAPTVQTIGAVALIEKIWVRFVASLRHKLLCDFGFREGNREAWSFIPSNASKAGTKNFVVDHFVGLRRERHGPTHGSREVAR